MTKRTCKIEGCNEPHRAHGLCRNHGYRLKRYSDPLGGLPPSPTACSIEDCGKVVVGRGWCGMHWRRWRLYGNPLVTSRNQPKPVCAVDDCEKVAVSHGWCTKHVQRWQRHGDPLALKRSPPAGLTNTICLIEDCEKPVKALGWCGMHYKRWTDYGTTDLPEHPKPPVQVCKIDDCGEEVECRGWCNRHYIRWRNHGDPLVFLYSDITDTCSQDDCVRRAAKSGVCWTHYRLLKVSLAEAQGHRCAICGMHEDDVTGGKLRLDHDHVTGKPRSMLCHHCNCGLGHFRDDPGRLLAAVAYLGWAV